MDYNIAVRRPSDSFAYVSFTFIHIFLRVGYMLVPIFGLYYSERKKDWNVLGTQYARTSEEM